jgi:hypothetical protein
MKQCIFASLLAVLLIASGCLMCPLYYSTGAVSGKVVDSETQLPVSNALVLAQVRIRSYEAMSGGHSKRVASGYSITDSEGTFNVPSMSTLYLAIAAITYERSANTYIVVYQPEYKAVGGQVELHKQSIWGTSRKRNTHGLEPLGDWFTGWYGIDIDRADKQAFRCIINELHENDENPSAKEDRLYRRLLK